MRQRLLILSVALAFLVGTYVVGRVAYQPRGEELRPAFPSLESPELIEITAAGQAITLESRESGWFVVEGDLSYPARSQRVEDLVDSARGARVGRVVSGGEEALAELGLAGDGAIEIRFREDGRSIEALIGNPGTAPETAYFRLPASTEARLLHSGIRFYASQRPAFWADLRVFFGRFAAGKVVRIDLQEIAEPRTTTTLFRRSEDDRWTVAGQEDAVIVSDRMETFVRTAATFEAGRFVPYQVDVGWARAIRLHLDDGRVFSLYVAAPETEGAPEDVRIMAEGPGLPIDENGFPYQNEVGQATVERLFPDIGSLTAGEQ